AWVVCRRLRSRVPRGRFVSKAPPALTRHASASLTAAGYGGHSYLSDEEHVGKRFNEFGQPVGFAVEDWQPRPRPPRAATTGRYCRIEPLNCERHAADLFAAYAQGD